MHGIYHAHHHFVNFTPEQTTAWGELTEAIRAGSATVGEKCAELEKTAAEALAAAQARSEALSGLSISISARAGDEGKLFGSIGTVDIAEAVNAAGVAVEKREIRMPEGPLRQIGEYEIGFHLHTDVNTSINVTVVAE